MPFNKLLATTFVAAQLALAGPVLADNDVFKGGWTLSEAGSNLHFISVKKGKIMESSTFAGLGGTIDEAGNAQFAVALDSIDTSVDLRNVRMRFLFFETFLHAQAEITTKVDSSMLEGLQENGSITAMLPFNLNLRGIDKKLEAEVIITLIGENRVSIAAAQPVIMKLEDFDLIAGMEKLQEAAGVEIVPATSVLFHLVFDRNDPTSSGEGLLASVAASPESALEPKDQFNRDACLGRFEILSRSGNINFLPGSADLTPASKPLLDSVTDIIGKCPGMVVKVAGHTDSNGGANYNMFLSERRAKAVVNYFVESGISQERLIDAGYGESKPIASNRTVNGRTANRRIEFSFAGFAGSS